MKNEEKRKHFAQQLADLRLALRKDLKFTKRLRFELKAKRLIKILEKLDDVD